LEVRKSTLEVEKSNRWTQNVPKEINFFILDNHRPHQDDLCSKWMRHLANRHFYCNANKTPERATKQEGWVVLVLSRRIYFRHDTLYLVVLDKRLESDAKLEGHWNDELTDMRTGPLHR